VIHVGELFSRSVPSIVSILKARSRDLGNDLERLSGIAKHI
jgi:hypothetical protein